MKILLQAVMGPKKVHHCIPQEPIGADFRVQVFGEEVIDMLPIDPDYVVSITVR